MREDDDMNEKRTEQVSLRIPESLHIDLMRLAAQDDRTVSDVVYRILRDSMYGMASRVARRADDRNENKGSR